MTLEAIKEKISKNKRLLEEKYNVKSIGIFGSFAKEISDKDSDIDILVEFSKTPDIFDFIKLEEFLSNLLGTKVDLVTKKALKPLIKETILKETVYI
jgi:hypothetical protein